MDRRGTGERLPVLWPVVALVAATILFRLTNLDRAACGLFFGGAATWPMVNQQPFKFIYDYGPCPGFVMLFAGIPVWLLGLLFHRGIARRAFFCYMVVLLGPGLTVNGILKPNVSRPRPCQTADFGGDHTFLPVLQLGTAGEGIELKSFPSGHASMGFALLAPALLLRRRRGWYPTAMGFAIGFGILIGATRIVQGRHFPSDVIWSAAIVYLTTVPLYYACGIDRLASLSLLNRTEFAESTGDAFAAAHEESVDGDEVITIPFPGTAVPGSVDIEPGRKMAA